MLQHFKKMLQHFKNAVAIIFFLSETVFGPLVRFLQNGFKLGFRVKFGFCHSHRKCSKHQGL